MFCEHLLNISPIAYEYKMNYENILDENFLYPERIVTHYELEYIEYVKDSAFIMVDGKKDYLQENCIHFRRPGAIVQGGGIYHSRYFCFSYNANSDTSDALSSMPGLYILGDSFAIKQVFNDIFNDYYTDCISIQLNFKINVLKIINYMINHWYFNTNNNENSERVKSIAQSAAFIAENFSLELSVNDLAQQTGYSLYHYSRLFKEYMNYTPIQYLMRCRINHAKKALAETTLSAQEIMLNCGFNSYSYFFRVFKSMNSMTPNEYRQTHSLFRKKE